MAYSFESWIESWHLELLWGKWASIQQLQDCLITLTPRSETRVEDYPDQLHWCLKLLKLAGSKIAEGTNLDVPVVSQSHSSPQDMPISLWVGMIHHSSKKKIELAGKSHSAKRSSNLMYQAGGSLPRLPRTRQERLSRVHAMMALCRRSIGSSRTCIAIWLGDLSTNHPRKTLLIRSSTHVLNTPNVRIP